MVYLSNVFVVWDSPRRAISLAAVVAASPSAIFSSHVSLVALSGLPEKPLDAISPASHASPGVRSMRLTSVYGLPSWMRGQIRKSSCSTTFPCGLQNFIAVPVLNEYLVVAGEGQY